jgi:SAM-dependent methyltransferase
MAEPGATQSWNAGRYQAHAGFVPVLGQPVLDLLQPKPGERVLDLGCGDGVLTAKLAAAGARVIGVDASEAMVEAARARGLDARLMDGAALDLGGGFDAVFSNAALHWMLDPDAVIQGVARTLKPGGRFVGEFGGHGNVAAITVALIAVLARRGVDGAACSPWYFPTAEAYGAKLERAGFVVDEIALIPRPTPLPTDMAGWLDTMAAAFFGSLPAAERAAAREEVIDLLRPCLADDQGRWTADYVRLRFAAHLPADG